MKDLRLSIVVPVYNVERYIEQCVRSLYDQDLPRDEYEVICVDDCSPDGSVAIIEKLQKEYSSLKLVRHARNKKLGGARNTGIRAAQGKYLVFVDSDDYYAPNVFGRLAREMESGDDQYVLFNLTMVNEDSQVVREPVHYPDSKQMSGMDLFLGSGIPWKDQVSACKKIYDVAFLREHKLYFAEDIMYEDNDYAFRVAALAKRCRFVDFSPYMCRTNAASETRRDVNPKRLMYWQKTWPLMLELLCSFGGQDKRFDEAVRFYLRYDLYDIMQNMRCLLVEERQQVKKAISATDWYRVIRLLPVRRRVKYIYDLIRL